MTLGGRLCSTLKYACCEPRAGDYDSCSEDGSIGTTSVIVRKEGRRGPQQQQRWQQYQQHSPGSAASSEISPSPGRYGREREVHTPNGRESYYREHHQLFLGKIGLSRPLSHEDFSDEVRSRDDEFSDRAWVESPDTDATRMVSPAMEKTPMPDTWRGQSLTASRDRPSRGTPPRAPPKKSRWTDAVLEGFLYSTLVDGTGLVLDKLDSEGKGKKCGERILSYDPDAMRLNWISTGMRRKPGSMLAKDIDDVICEGTSVTIFYIQASSRPRGGAAAVAAASPVRRRSLSPWRRASVPAGQTKVNRRRKAFQVAEERDAQILSELLLFVRRQAVVAACSSSAAGADAAASSRWAASSGASSASLGSSVSDAGFRPDGGVVPPTAADAAAGGRSKRNRRRSVM